MLTAPQNPPAATKPDVQDLASELMACDAQLRTLKAKTDLGLAQQEARDYAVIRDLRAREKRIEKMLAELSEGHSAGSQECETHLAHATEELKEALSRAISESPWCH